MMTALNVAALLGYLGASFLFLGDLAVTGTRFGVWGLWLCRGTAVVHVAALAAMGFSSDGLSSIWAMPGALSLVALFVVAGYLVVERVYKVRQIGSLVGPVAAVLLAAGAFAQHRFPVTVSDGSVLLVVHVALAFLGTAAFALAFFLAVLYSIQEYQLKNKRFGVLFQSLPALERLDQVAFRCVSAGFPTYTLAILLGFWRARQAQGDLFSASMVLAVITWVVYAAVVHTRLIAGWRGRKAAHLTIAGFIAAAGVVVVYLVR